MRRDSRELQLVSGDIDNAALSDHAVSSRLRHAEKVMHRSDKSMLSS